MKKVITVVLALTLAACGSVPYLSPGIQHHHMIAAVSECKDKGGVHMVTQSAFGVYTAFCQDTGTEMFSIK